VGILGKNGGGKVREKAKRQKSKIKREKYKAEGKKLRVFCLENRLAGL